MNDETRHEKLLAEALAIAFPKARSLGYSLQAMQVTLHIVDDICIVYLAPIPKQDQPVLGGDVTLHVDLKLRTVVKISRGQ